MEDVLLPVPAGGEKRGFLVKTKHWYYRWIGIRIRIASTSVLFPFHNWPNTVWSCPHGRKRHNVGSNSEKALHPQVNKENEWENQRQETAQQEIEKDLRIKKSGWSLSEIMRSKAPTSVTERTQHL